MSCRCFMFSKYIEQAYHINIFKRTNNVYKQTKDNNTINTMVNDKVQLNSRDSCDKCSSETKQ